MCLYYNISKYYISQEIVRIFTYSFESNNINKWSSIIYCKQFDLTASYSSYDVTEWEIFFLYQLNLQDHDFDNA